jgi:transcriptional regulator GlxA family with amidase domain
MIAGPQLGGRSMATHRIAFILFDGCEILDIAGPACVFSTAARLAARRFASDRPLFATAYYSARGGLVRTIDALAVDTAPLGAVAAHGADTLIVAGGPTPFAVDQPLLVDWLRAHGRDYERIGAICTGSFILAQAGLLEGRRAACHWEDCDLFAVAHPAVLLDRHALFVGDGDRWTTAGASAGIDMALAMLEQDVGHALAHEVARQLVLFVKRDGREAQLSTLLRAQSGTGPLGDLLGWAASHPGADLSVETLAERAHMSVRNFYRSFERLTHMSPGAWVERSRVEAARRLLEQSERRVEQIAGDVGFGSCDRMRRAFLRNLGTSPAAYRQHCRPAGAEAGVPARLASAAVAAPAADRAIDDPGLVASLAPQFGEARV